MRSDEPAWSPPGRMIFEGRRPSFVSPGVMTHVYGCGPYIVSVTLLSGSKGPLRAMIQVARHDGLSPTDWRDKQWFKDQLVGADGYAVEIYPPRDQIRDPSNAAFLWVLNDPIEGIGWDVGRIMSAEDASAPQRAFEAGKWPPVLSSDAHRPRPTRPDGSPASDHPTTPPPDLSAPEPERA